MDSNVDAACAFVPGLTFAGDRTFAGVVILEGGGVIVPAMGPVPMIYCFGWLSEGSCGEVDGMGASGSGVPCSDLSPGLDHIIDGEWWTIVAG